MKKPSIKPDFAEAYFNIGNTLKDQEKLEETTQSYNKAISVKPDYAEAYNNVGLTLHDQDKSENIDAYTKALSIKLD